MTKLLEIREYLRGFYAKNEVYVNPCIKFLVAFITLIVINGSLGYMSLLKNIAVVLVVALMCAFMPKNFVVIVSAGWILLHSYALAMECAAVVAAMFVIMFLVYFRFAPKDTLVVLITPLLFAFKVPFVVPVAMGLLTGPMSMVSMSCGVVVYYMINYIIANVTVFSATDAETGSKKLKIMLDGILNNKAMIITVIVFCVVLILVYVIRRMAIAHAWTVAIISGLSVGAVLLLICEFMMELKFSVLEIVLGSILSFLVCSVVQFLEFNVDYSRTEVVQFEDDEYYYYVKAVPKNMLAVPDKSVKRINKQHRKTASRQEGAVKTIKTSHGVSRTTGKNDEDIENRVRQGKQ